MGFFNEYPYTDFHEINLDWILRQIMKLHKDYDEFKALNTITFSGEWDITNQYPAWTIVNTNNGTEAYISVQPVPAGITLDNYNYWRFVANYTNVLADLQNRVVTLEGDVQTLDARVSALEDMTCIVLTDSYGNYTNVDGRNFIGEAFNSLGITSFYDFHLGSAGFSRTGALNFLSVLQANESVIPDKNNITDVIVCGGANDQISANIAQTLPGIQAFISYVKTEYPNAKIHIGHFTNTLENGLVELYRQSVFLYEQCVNYGAAYMENSQHIMRKLAFFNSDNVHPSQDGIAALAKYLASYLLNGHIDVNEYADSTIAAGSATVYNDRLKQIQHNGTITYKFQGLSMGSFIPGSPLSIVSGENTFDNILTFSDGFCYSDDGINVSFDGYFMTATLHLPASVYVKKIAANKVVNLGLIVYSDAAYTVSSNFSLVFGTVAFDNM